jgi:hypothetical protein
LSSGISLHAFYVASHLMMDERNLDDIFI